MVEEATVIRGGEACSEMLEEAIVIEGGEAMAKQLAGKSKDLGKNTHGRENIYSANKYQ
jgi:hypothetical protein